MWNDTIKLLLILMLIGIGHSFECEDSDYCDCQYDPDNNYEIRCPKDMFTEFRITIRPTSFVTVNCFRSPSWSRFNFNSNESVGNVNSLKFFMCQLPEEPLSDISNRLGVETTRALTFTEANLGSNLTRRHLSEFSEVEFLDLSANHLTKIPVDLFADFPILDTLDLSQNNVILPRGIFSGLKKLQKVSLGYNMMTDIDEKVFENLTNMTFLSLCGNRLTDLSAGIFENLIQLQTLDINGNNLTNLPNNIFDAMKSLEVLYLHHNQFSSLPVDLLKHNVNLDRFKLNQNRGNLTSLPEGFFSDLIQLTDVDLAKNNLMMLPENTFRGTVKLQNLNLKKNLLTNLPTNIFKDLKNLVSLDLSENQLNNLRDGIFNSLGKLVKLNLSNNNITSISGILFSALKSLQELNLNSNGLVHISVYSFTNLENLLVARLSNNFITFEDPAYGPISTGFGSMSPFKSTTNIKELYLDHNNITNVFADWRMSLPNLRVLDLSWNNISYLSAVHLNFLFRSIKVDMSHNNISTIDIRVDDQNSFAEMYKNNTMIFIDRNPIQCGCNLYGYLKYVEKHPNHIAAKELECAGPPALKGQPVSGLKSQTFSCTPQNEGKDNILCPEKCDCQFRRDDTTVLVNCSYRNLSRTPDGMTKLPKVNIDLNLVGNYLTEFPSINQSGLDNVTILRLSHNNINNILLDVLPKKLMVLELNHNNLTRLNSVLLESMRNSTFLKNITLHANPWKCDCQAQDFLKFTQMKFGNISNLQNVTCGDTNQQFAGLTMTDLCPLDIATIIGISLAIAILGVLIGALAALYYRYKHELKVWLYAHQTCLWFVSEEELDRDKQYDAFISYSHIDEDFVVNELVAKLEQGPNPFKICVHYRDWLAGEWIPSQIATSVANSRRTIVVLSPNFMQSVWGRMEFRAAHSQALKEGRARVIVILYEDVGPIEDLDAELKAYLTMNTYIKWGDPWFWKKLRYGLPHPPQITRNIIYENHQCHTKHHGDTNELIHPPDMPQTPPPITTPPADTLKTFLSNDSLKKKSLIIECSNLDTPNLNGTNKKTNSNPTMNNYVRNMINAQCTPV